MLTLLTRDQIIKQILMYSVVIHEILILISTEEGPKSLKRSSREFNLIFGIVELTLVRTNSFILYSSLQILQNNKRLQITNCG